MLLYELACIAFAYLECVTTPHLTQGRQSDSNKAQQHHCPVVILQRAHSAQIFRCLLLCGHIHTHTVSLRFDTDCCDIRVSVQSLALVENAWHCNTPVRNEKLN